MSSDSDGVAVKFTDGHVPPPLATVATLDWLAVGDQAPWCPFSSYVYT
jgi:hypothetical protein